jgi:hypothetical protein
MTLEQALRKAYQLGQIYWQQADSESYSDNKKSFETSAKFDALLQDTIDAHIAQHAETERQRNFWEDACDVTHNHWQAEIDKHAEMVAKLRELEGMWTQPIAASASFEERVRSSARVMCANQLEYRLLSSLDAQPATNVSESSSKLVGAVDVDARESE